MSCLFSAHLLMRRTVHPRHPTTALNGPRPVRTKVTTNGPTANCARTRQPNVCWSGEQIRNRHGGLKRQDDHKTLLSCLLPSSSTSISNSCYAAAALTTPLRALKHRAHRTKRRRTHAFSHGTVAGDTAAIAAKSVARPTAMHISS